MTSPPLNGYDVTDLKIGQAVLTGKVEGIENRLNSWEENQKYVKTFFLSSNP
ncbi:MULTISPECIES: hypothetical protein [Microcystis]|uniref:Uncharacterized protein n=1 Tax=Microcystis aeruginosa NIES-44 TaxID=449439 RepID=A0A0A1VYT6_MICAE|nr:hypothetical protein [Microcystis sp. LE17-20A]MCZ8040765.1 hypothetical protein [Microcystis sp. LE17-20A]MCZ8211241.1 hypothetical protein [Microcystis sp. LE19-8.1F]GAL94905.1 hypothetical protein N44_03760 [Microcystis aeruginosa NIES-44]